MLSNVQLRLRGRACLVFPLVSARPTDERLGRRAAAALARAAAALAVAGGDDAEEGEERGEGREREQEEGSGQPEPVVGGERGDARERREGGGAEAAGEAEEGADARRDASAPLEHRERVGKVAGDADARDGGAEPEGPGVA